MVSKLDITRAGVLFVLSFWSGTGSFGGEALEIKRVVTTILADDVDTCAAFWIERLGFQQTIAVPAQEPGETGNQFVSVGNDRHEVMFQSIKSAEEELPGVFSLANPRSFMLYIEVGDLGAAIERMQGLEPAITRRTTFYGSEEIGYRDPCGTLVVLADFSGAQEEDSTGANDP